MEKLQLGKRNKLRVLRILPHGAYLDGGEIGDILLPTRYLPEGVAVGDIVDVFLYLDHEERLTATTQHPYIEVGQYAYLKCAWTNQYGAYLDWGLQKDLFCPFREQRTRMEVGKRYLVYCYIDSLTYRIVCTSRVDRLHAADESASSRPTLIDDFAPRLQQWLVEHEGFCPLHDHTPAEEIYNVFGVSKKVFKQAVGKLYKQHAITLGDDGIRLVAED